MRSGNTISIFRGAILAFAFMGIGLSLSLLIAAIPHHTPGAKWLVLFAPSLLPTILSTSCFPTFLFPIQINNERVQYRFLNHLVL
jgi:hypothetical protein